MIRPALIAMLMPGVALAAPEFQAVTYYCDRGVQVPATYVNTPEGSLVVLMVDGRQITLLGEQAASGARYGWPSDGSTYVWWTKGQEATLYWKTPEGENPIATCLGDG
ncbi:MliC family protein [Rhodobacter calidifons]|uniref:Lysozyme inhibitor n=1 Tax=Rhodobacter calidifons TaxID=2715277 RepID=A0ABX0G7H8_9RHOB|nr:MliC family protein [Rhodobacter calidifons]NHB76814.1 lysozyme inhibitor [Rhodobacter calidifons]